MLCLSNTYLIIVNAILLLTQYIVTPGLFSHKGKYVIAMTIVVTDNEGIFSVYLHKLEP